MYSQDSFFDLSTWGQVGLACLSLALFALFLALARTFRRTKSFGLRILGALSLLWVFVWLTPQIYYLYYWLTFPDLPLQSVIKPPPNPIETLKLLVFQGRDNLSDHSKGLLGWALIAAPFLNFPRRHRKTAE
ncbi:hypothetical protein N9L47_02435 [Rhodobacteraceae bacterium]|nr:hypothetical protein [Paracoccaceae bacterium]